MSNDTRTLEQRYEDMRAERNELEHRVFVLAEMFTHPALANGSQCLVPECGDFIAFDKTNMPLCAEHLIRAGHDYKRWVETVMDGDPLPAAEAEMKTNVVYYVRLSGRVKIGTTVNLRARLAAFSAIPEQLLAVEPGGYAREAERHRQFASTRLQSTELFDITPELEDHISLVRRTFGDPLPLLART